MWLIAVAVIAALIAVRRSFLVVSVVGRSMMPTFRDGERLLARRTRRARRGDVVAFVPPAGHRHFTELVYRVKRVAAVAGDPAPPWLGDECVPAGKLVVLGDNPNSEDSRHYGYVDRAAIVGVITGR